MPNVEDELEVIDPLDNRVVDVSFTAREMYTVLESLYHDITNVPDEVLEIITYLENRLLDRNLPLSKTEFSSEYVNDHSDTEQYKRLAVWLSE